MSVVRRLYQLQVLDSERDRASYRLEEVEQGLGASDEVLRARGAVAEASSAVLKSKADSRALELEIGSLNAKMKANEEKLYGGKVRNPKELAGLQEESGALRRRRSEIEDQQLDLLIQLDTQNAELSERQARLGQIQASWQEQQASLQAEKRQLEQRLADLDDQCNEVRAQVPNADLAMYDDLRNTLGGIAVAQLKRGICQVCGVDVPTELSLAAQRGEGSQFCPICCRLLYGGG